MKRILFLAFIFSMFVLSNSFAAYKQTWKINYDTTTERGTAFLVGDMYVATSTNTADANVKLNSGGVNPIQLYSGDLQVLTTGYGIRFADGSKQISAGIGSATNVLSSTGTVLINSDTDDSGDEPIIFQTDGAVERMRIASGLLEIKTSTDTKIAFGINSGSNTIHSYNNAGDANTPLQIRASNTEFSAGGILVNTIQSSPNNTLSINAAGSNVGIGTSTPKALLHIATTTINSNFSVMIDPTGIGAYTYANGNFNGLYFGRFGDYPSIQCFGDASHTGSLLINPEYGGTLKIYGTTNFFPDGKAFGAADAYMRISSTGDDDIRIVCSNTNDSILPISFVASKYSFETGNIGIGDATPEEKLKVYGNISVDSSAETLIKLNAASNQSTSIWLQHAESAKASVNLEATTHDFILWTNNGSWNKAITMYNSNNTVGVTTLAGSGNRSVYSDPSGVLTNSSSSKRYKENIENIEFDIENVYKLRPVTFTWKKEKDKYQSKDFGMIAEEVNELFPDLIFKNIDGTCEGIHYEKVCIYLIGALKSQNERIKVLESKILSVNEN